MGIIGIISAVLKLLMLWFSRKIERDAKRREQLEAASKELKSGIDKRDSSAVTRAFDSVRRLR